MADSPSYLILGATGGIGSRVTRMLADRGADLAIGARSEDDLEALADETGAHPISLDATVYDQVEAAVEEAHEELGGLDGVANCVGSILLKPAHLTSVEEFDRVMKVNVYSSFYLVKAAARRLMKTGGSVVLSSAAVGLHGVANHEAIAAAKAGVAGLVRSAAATYGLQGVRVNAVAPGLVDTPLTERLTKNEASLEQSKKMHALGRIGQPDEVASAIAWLLDDETSSWVTGQVLGVDGGLSAVRARD